MVQHMRQEETGHSEIIWDAAPLSHTPGILPSNDITDSDNDDGDAIKTHDTSTTDDTVCRYFF